MQIWLTNSARPERFRPRQGLLRLALRTVSLTNHPDVDDMEAEGGVDPHNRKRCSKGETAMAMLTKTLAVVAAGTVLAASAFAQTAREILGASPYVEIDKEPAPKLIVDPPLPEGLARGIFWAQYRVENVRILPVFGAGALQASPRVGHLHISVDDLPWWWAEASDNNTLDIAGLPPGQHKVTIELVDANHRVFRGQVVTLRFTVPDRAK
jgi:hypothetical protein